MLTAMRLMLRLKDTIDSQGIIMTYQPYETKGPHDLHQAFQLPKKRNVSTVELEASTKETEEILSEIKKLKEKID